MPALYSPVVYAAIEDLESCAIPPRAFDGLQPTDKERALAMASRTIDNYLSQRYELPLKSWDNDLTQWCCVIAGYRLLCFRGWNPDDLANSGVTGLYREALEYLRLVKIGQLTLNVATTAPDPTFEPDIATSPMRGI